MSFWTIIGLADSNSIMELQKEVLSLREENATIVEQNKVLLEELIESRTKEMMNLFKDNAEHHLEKLQTSTLEIKNTVGAFEKNILECNTNSFNEVKSWNESVLGTIKNCNTEISDKFKLVMDAQEKNSTKHNANFEELRSYVLQINETVSKIIEITSHNQEILNTHATNVKGSFVNEAQKVDTLLVHSKEMMEQISDIETIGAEIALLNEAVKNLWAIMKAVWVDSLLSEIDNIKR